MSSAKCPKRCIDPNVLKLIHPSGHITQNWRRYYVKTTSLWRYYVTMTSFWRNNDVIITSCVQGDVCKRGPWKVALCVIKPNENKHRSPIRLLSSGMACSNPAWWRHVNMRHWHCYVILVGCSRASTLARSLYSLLNSLWPSYAIWRHRSESTLAEVMACCLTTPSHYLNQCWLAITKVL